MGRLWRFLHIKINTFLVQEQFPSKRGAQRGRLSMQLRGKSGKRGEWEGCGCTGKWRRKANNLIKTSIKNCKNTTTQAAVKMFMQN